MKSMKKIIAMLVAVLMLVGVFAGCGKKNDSNGKTDTNAAGTTTQGSSDKTADTEPEKELEGTININVSAGPGLQEAWKAVADAYMAMHPKVEVVIDLKPKEGYAEWITNMFGTANPSADLVSINMAADAKTGKSINFMEYANDDSPYSDGIWKEQLDFEMQPKYMSQNVWDMLCLQSTQVMWFYNRDIFKKVGVKPPTTWNELIEVSEKLMNAGYQPIACPGDLNSFWAMQMGWLAQVYVDQTTRSLLDVIRAKDGDYLYDPDVDGKFKLDLSDPFNDDAWKVNQNPVRAAKALKDGVYKPDSEGMKTVWSNFQKVFPKYAGGNAFFGTTDALPLFYQGKAAMYIDGGWRIPQFKRDMDKIASGEEITSGDDKIEGVQKFELDTFNMPSMEGPGIEAPARTIEVATGFLGAVKKEKAHDDLVVDFLMYYSSKDGFSKYMTAGLENGWVPNGPPLVKNVELPEEYASMFANVKFIGNVQKGYGQMIARGATGDIQESLREWYEYSQAFLTNKITVDDWAAKHKANVLKYWPETLKFLRITESDLENPQNQPTGK